MADDYAAGITTTGSLAVGGSKTGTINSNGDYDWLKMSLTGGKVYRVDVTSSNTALVNPAIDAIYTAGGNPIAGTFNDDYFGTKDARAYFAPVSSGTYYASIYNSYYYGTGGYTVTLTEVPPGASDYTPSFVFSSQSSTSTSEGGSLNFCIQRLGNISTAANVSWSIAGSGSYSVDAADFFNGGLPGGSIFFGANVIEKWISIYTNDDNIYEGDETFTLTVTPQAGSQESPVSTMATIQNNDPAPVISLVAAPVQEKDEGAAGSTTYTFSLERSGDLYLPSTVNWAATGNGANPADGADFAGGMLPSGTVTFAAGEASQTITVDVQGDDAFEQNEEFTVTLSDPGMAVLSADNAATAAIINDDVAYTVTSAGSALPEGNSGSTPHTFTVKSHYNVSSGSTLKWEVSGTEVTKDDFADGKLPSGTLEFKAGEDTQTITVNVQGDTGIERDETFTLTLSPPQNGDWPSFDATAAILDDDADYVITPATVSKDEGNSGSTAHTFTVRSNYNVSTGSSVAWAVAGTGAHPADAADFQNGLLPSGTVTFAANETTKTITINLQGDIVAEEDEGFAVTLASSGSKQPLPASGTITNDDTNLVIAAAATPPAAEGNSGSTPYTFAVTRSGKLDVSSTAEWTVAGSGTNPANATDFTGGAFPSGTVAFAANEITKTITVNVQGETTVESDETFSVILTNPAGATVTTGTASGTIKNDDTGLAITAPVTPPAAEGNSGSTPYTFTVTRSGNLTAASTANWAVTGSGANQENQAAATDFTGGTFPSGTVTFAANETTKTITVDVLGDTTYEQNESFTVTLSNPAGTTLITPTAIGTIVNDDTGLAITAPVTPPAAEGSSGSTPYTFTVTRSGNLTAASTANWVVSGSGTNPANVTDFTGSAYPSGTVAFAAGEATKAITVNVLGDTSIEPDETFAVTLSDAFGATLTTSTASATIKDDDLMSRIFLAPGTPESPSTCTAASSGTIIYGGAAPEVVTLSSGVTEVTVNQNIERVKLSGEVSSYTFKQSGASLLVYDTVGSTKIVTIPLQMDADGTQIGFGSSAFDAKLNLATGAMTIGGATVSDGAAAAINPTLQTTVPEPGAASPGATMYMTLDSSVTAAVSGAKVYGNSGTETLTIAPTANNITFNQSIEKIKLSGAAAAYSFKQGADSLLNIFTADGATLIAKGALQSDSDGTLLTFAGAAGTAVPISAAVTRAATAGVDIFTIAAGTASYTCTISGFGTGDKLLFPAGATPAVTNSNLTDGIIDLLYTAGGQTATIHLTGISAADDTALGTDIGNFA